MNKKTTKVARAADKNLADGVEEILAHKQGKTKLATYSVPVPDVDIRAIREHLNLSQSAFAERFHVPLGTLQGWEQGRREPDNVARVFLKMIDTNPKKVEELINTAVLENNAAV